MVAQLGYQGIRASWWSEELKGLALMKERWGLDVGGVYAKYRQGLENMLVELAESLEGCSTIEPALHSGESVQDVDFRILEKLLREHLENGALVRVLQPFDPAPLTLYALWPKSCHLRPKSAA